MRNNHRKSLGNPHTIIISSFTVFIFLLAVFAAFVVLVGKYYPTEQNFVPQITIITYDTPTISLEKDRAYLSATATTDVILQKFSKGLKVKIHGTGDDGLRIHQDPGEKSPTIFLAAEGDLFSIEEGPMFIGGYIWWRIKSNLDEKINGWAAEDFLQIAIKKP